MGNGYFKMTGEEAIEYRNKQNIKSRHKEIAKWQREQERLNEQQYKGLNKQEQEILKFRSKKSSIYIGGH